MTRVTNHEYTKSRCQKSEAPARNVCSGASRGTSLIGISLFYLFWKWGAILPHVQNKLSIQLTVSETKPVQYRAIPTSIVWCLFVVFFSFGKTFVTWLGGNHHPSRAWAKVFTPLRFACSADNIFSRAVKTCRAGCPFAAGFVVWNKEGWTQKFYNYYDVHALDGGEQGLSAFKKTIKQT